MKSTMRSTFAAALVASLAVPAAAQDPRRQDFAYAIAVRPESDAPLFRVRLPLAVYRGVTRPDLGDLRVFNAGGALIPYELWSPENEEKVEERVLEARVFPLLSATPEEISAIRIQLESGGERAEVALSSGAAPTRVAAYVLDVGSVDRSTVAERLVLEWERSNEGFVQPIRIEESDDLSTWRTLASGVVADLSRGGQRLLKNEIHLGANAARYLKLTSSDGPIPMSLTAADIVVSSRTEREETTWLEIPDLRSEEEGLLFETPGPILVESIDVLPSERNTWTEVQLFSRPDSKAEWVLRESSVVYRFEVGADTRLGVRRTRDRFWKLTTDGARGGFGESAPGVRVGFRPDDVVFVARGEAPFEIAYGSGRVGPAPRSTESLRTLTSSEGIRLQPATDVALGEPRELAGENALREPLIPDWKRFVLWGVLVAASLALLFTARAALRDPGAK